MGQFKVFVSLVLAWILRGFKRRPLWLVSDCHDRAGDNGEAFYRYLVREHPEIDARFVLGVQTPEYAGLAKIGPVVPWRSLRRKVLTLLADCLVSSQAERGFMNPFAGYDRFVRQKVHRIPFVFLQHGVTKDDLSSFVRSRERPLSAIVCTARREAESFLLPQYALRREQIWLTGLPRHDGLTNAARKCVMVMPTWRRCFADDPDAARTFEAFYRRFLSDDELLRTCRANGYQIVFAPHPNLRRHIHLDVDGDVVRTASEGASYRTLISEGAMLITDYSSLAFDFAYLQKPVVYVQYDQAEFWNGAHTYQKGYFDYERDGFGPVVKTVEELVDVIKKRLSSQADPEDGYLARARAFFAYPGDTENSKRVFERIVGLLSPRER